MTNTLPFRVGAFVSRRPMVVIGAFLLLGTAIGTVWYILGTSAREIANVQRLTEMVLHRMQVGGRPYEFDKSEVSLLTPVRWERVETWATKRPFEKLGVKATHLIFDTLIIDSSNKGGQPIRLTWHFTWAHVAGEGLQLINLRNTHEDP